MSSLYKSAARPAFAAASAEEALADKFPEQFWQLHTTSFKKISAKATTPSKLHLLF